MIKKMLIYLCFISIITLRFNVFCSNESTNDSNIKLNVNSDSDIYSDIELSLDFQHKQLSPKVLSISKAVLNFKTVNSEQFSKLSKDFIFVVDRSGSMAGNKIKNVISTLKKLMKYLTENDRVQIVSFSYDSKVEISNSGFFSDLLGIASDLLVSCKEIEIIEKSIDKIIANGGTNIWSGLNTAINILKERKQKADVEAIFLLSDGEDNNREELEKTLLNNYRTFGDIVRSIHTLGYGENHDTDQMQLIARLGRGNYYNIESNENIGKVIAESYGGMMSIFAHDLTIKVHPNKNVKITKSSNEYFKEVCENSSCHWEYKQPYVTFGMDLNIIFEFELINLNSDLNSHSNHINNEDDLFSIEYNVKGKPTKKGIIKNSLRVVSDNLNNVNFLGIENIRSENEFIFVKFETSENIKKANEFLKSGQQKEAKEALKNYSDKVLNNARFKNDERFDKLKILVEETADLVQENDQVKMKIMTNSAQEKLVYNQYQFSKKSATNKMKEELDL